MRLLLFTFPLLFVTACATSNGKTAGSKPQGKRDVANAAKERKVCYTENGQEYCVGLLPKRFTYQVNVDKPEVGSSLVLLDEMSRGCWVRKEFARKAGFSLAELKQIFSQDNVTVFCKRPAKNADLEVTGFVTSYPQED